MPKLDVSDERRRQLTSSARKVIAAKGTAHATLRDVAVDAGVSTGIVSYYFDSKRDLLRAAVRAAAEDFSRRVDKTDSAETDPWTRLDAHVSALFEGSEKRRRQELAFWAACWSEAARADDVRLVHRDHFQDWCAHLASIIRAGQEARVMDATRGADDLAGFVACALDGLWLHSVISRETAPPTRLGDLTSELLRRVLAPTS